MLLLRTRAYRCALQAGPAASELRFTFVDEVAGVTSRRRLVAALQAAGETVPFDIVVVDPLIPLPK